MEFVTIRSLPLLMAGIFCLQAGAQEQEPMMVKSQSGVPLNAEFDWSMCRTDGVAVGGYDLTSYRMPNGPIRGNREFTAEHDGQTYLFSSESNLALFEQDPERYLPAYAGFCAITLALGRITCPEYTNFKIEDDQLLLFETTGFTNGRTLWNSDAGVFRQQADNNFEQLIDSR